MKDIPDTDDDGEDHRPNPFDPKRLRIGQRVGEGQDVRRVLVSVLVRKPNRQEFFRTHPDPAMSVELALLEFKQDRQSFIITPEMAPYLPGEAVVKLVVPTITIHGAVFLWPSGAATANRHARQLPARRCSIHRAAPARREA